jgi:hypothetical protein
MLTQRLSPRRRWLVAALVATALAAGTAVAKITRNTIDAAALLTDSGRAVIVTGPLTCTPDERVFLSVTITQRSTGALAEGRGVITCSGEAQQWEVGAALQARATFVDGPAIAVAVARATDHGITTDAHQWLVDVTLVTE